MMWHFQRKTKSCPENCTTWNHIHLVECDPSTALRFRLIGSFCTTFRVHYLPFSFMRKIWPLNSMSSYISKAVWNIKCPWIMLFKVLKSTGDAWVQNQFADVILLNNSELCWGTHSERERKKLTHAFHIKILIQYSINVYNHAPKKTGKSSASK